MVRETGRRSAEDCEAAPRLARFCQLPSTLVGSTRGGAAKTLRAMAEPRHEERIGAGGLVGSGPHFLGPELTQPWVK